jgi:arylsulfatase A-like enzyme
MTISRRAFLHSAGAASLAATGALSSCAVAHRQPNVILMMADDLGWGDVAYNGHPVIKTPALDAMAKNGVQFNRFYSGSAVCSPTRGSAITGRHPYRYGIPGANSGHMLPEEITLAEALKTQGYTTGHFGKWHLGTLTTKEKDANRGGPEHAQHYSPPWENGFDVTFATESKVPTYDPMITPVGWNNNPGQPFGTYYWSGPDQKVTENLEGDDSRVIMDRAIPFIQNAVAEETPFFSIIWFHTPHKPVVAGPKHRGIYADRPDKEQHYFGCISAMDEQIGRLRNELRTLGVADNTVVFFCSDNGHENGEPGSSGPYRGRKRSLFEGGVRVPGIVEWPMMVRYPHAVDMACSTLDYFPTVMDILGFQMAGQPKPLDGISLLPLLEGRMRARNKPIGFQYSDAVSIVDDRYKLIRPGKGDVNAEAVTKDETGKFMLFDLIDDPGEQNDLAASKPDIVQSMQQQLDKFIASCAASNAGEDYQ